MQIQYDGAQSHQLEAIATVLRLFSGARPQSSALPKQNTTVLFNSPVVANMPPWTDHANLLAKVQEVQKSQEPPLPADDKLRNIEEAFDDSASNGLVAGHTVSFPNFAIEMETATGKTYLFLRTIREMIQKCGLLKFIIITPSVAVRENILHSLASLSSHFSTLYDKPCEWSAYKAQKTHIVQRFAASASAQIMVMTIDSFNKRLNVIRQDADHLSGEIPLTMLQAVRPVLILDEPQNMESELSVKSLALLNPLFALRYSATHRKNYNLLYRLSPTAAYRLGLVKQIQIGSITAKRSDPFVRVEKVHHRGNMPVAKIAFNIIRKGRLTKRSMEMKKFNIIGNYSQLREYDQWKISNIKILDEQKSVDFNNGITLQQGEESGGVNKQILQAQISKMIQTHFDRQKDMRSKGVKVLSLFFIDRVDNYQPADGEIRLLFEECFNTIKKDYPEWSDLPAASVHNGYFAKSAKGNSEKDAEAFNLIMRDKESLLTFAAANDDDETRRKRQVCFIFSHSALREGWDNPNIFQICTLNRARSEMRRRQEIGRGLRLVVDQQGRRLRHKSDNLLTVIADEDYQEYVKNYQQEINEDYRDVIEDRLGKPLNEATEEEISKLHEEYGSGIIPPPLASNTAQTCRRHISKNKKGEAVFSAEFRALWERISQKTSYRLKLDGKKLLDNVVANIKNQSIQMPTIEYQESIVGVLEDGTFGAEPVSGIDTVAKIKGSHAAVDAIGLARYLLDTEDLPLLFSRSVLSKIAKRAGKKMLEANPRAWAAMTARVIREQIAELGADGVEYQKLDNQFYEWEQHFSNFAEEEYQIASAFVARMKNDKAPFKLIECDSTVEKEFAEEMDRRRDVEIFLKLPRNFYVPTPIGNYNPDWAVLMQDNKGHKRLYFIAETKSAVDDDGNVQENNLRLAEMLKIRYARRHFGSTKPKTEGALNGVDYRVIKNASQLP
ncbi:MAG: DEAD/DEAH box helicase family protein [Gammaproteobacteria bacterium]